ncbi:MAG: hypothetical protein RRZ69_00020 [Clostridia bacterium]
MVDNLQRGCVELMSIGLSYDDYWYGELEKANMFISAFQKQEIRKLKDSDFNNWSLASYIAMAVWQDKKSPYPKEPRLAHYGDKPKTIEQKAQERKEQAQEQCRRFE